MKPVKILNSMECFKLLDALITGYGTPVKRPKAVRNWALGILMLDTGIRVGELVQLQVRDLFFNSLPVKSIIVRAEIAKNNAERTIPVSIRLANALMQRFETIAPLGGRFEGCFVFNGGKPHTPMTTRQVERIIRDAAIRGIGRPVHPHALRHTFASRLMRVTDMRTVQLLLGHKNLSSTQIYTHPNSDDLTKAIGALDAVGYNNISQQT